MKQITPIFALLLLSPAVFAADARSTPPAWSWGAGNWDTSVEVDTATCQNIHTPVAGSKVGASDTGESCPAETPVASGYLFGKKKKTIYKDPAKYSAIRTCHRSYRTKGGTHFDTCPSKTWSGKVTNPTTGKQWNQYNDPTQEWKSCEPEWGGGFLCDEGWSYREFVEFPSTTSYTIDPDKIYTRCCAAKW